MVSIIIPCFNGEKFIDRCFNSILSQTYKDLEIILVNDGSTDESEKILERWKKKFKSNDMIYKYIYQENRGPGSAINTGLKYVSGKYLSLLDIDDYIMPESIELKVEFLEKNDDYDIVRTNGYYVSESNLDDQSRVFITNDLEKQQIYIFDSLVESRTNNWAGSYMVRTNKLFDFYKDRNIYESKYGQNLQILMPLAYKGKAGFIDKPLMKYIRQEKSLSQLRGDINFDIKNMLGYKDIRQNMIQIILKDKERKKYLDTIEITYFRYFMSLAVQYNNLEFLEENYKKLRKYNAETLEDKITYYNTKNRVVGLILRVIRKLNIKRK